jgi:hypothetical protein
MKVIFRDSPERSGEIWRATLGARRNIDTSGGVEYSYELLKVALPIFEYLSTIAIACTIQNNFGVDI